MNNVHDELLEHMRLHGVIPKNPSDVRLDGSIHRFAVEDDKPGKKTGWVVGYTDGVPNAKFGDWRHNSEGLKWIASRKAAQQPAIQKIDPCAKVEKEQARQNEQQQASMSASELWERSPSADPEHKYLLRKSVLPYGLRQDNDCLLVPFRNLQTGEIQTLQRISLDGEKKFFIGAAKVGSAYCLAADIKSGVVLICEGVATAHTLHEMTSLTVVAAGDCGNLKAIAKAVAAKFKGRKVLAAADNDHQKEVNAGLEAAKAAVKAGELAGIITPSFGAGQGGSDWNDFYALHGEDETCKALQKQIKEAIGGENTQQNPIIVDMTQLISPIDPNTHKNPPELLGGMFARSRVSTLFAAPGSAKSFLIQRLFHDLARGGDVLDGFAFQETPLRTLIIAGEESRSLYDIRAKIMKLEKLPNELIADIDSFSDSGFSVDLISDSGRETIAKILDAAQPDIVALDSFTAFFSIAENDQETLKNTMVWLREEARRRDIALVIVHHSRKRSLKEQTAEPVLDELCGSSVLARWLGAAISIQATKPDNTTEKIYTVRSAKARDGRDIKPFQFQLLGAGGTGVKMSINLSPVLEEKQDSKENLLETIESEFNGGEEFSRKDIEGISAYSKATIASALKHLTENRQITKIGSGSNIRYRLALNATERMAREISKLNEERTEAAS